MPKGTKPNPRTFRPLLARREAFLLQLVESGSPGARAELNMYESYRRSGGAPNAPLQRLDEVLEEAV